MPKSDTGPSDGVPGDPPRGGTGGVGLCCACPASGRVNTIGDTTYFTVGYANWQILNKCALSIVRTSNGGTVTLSKSFSRSYSNGATQAAHGGTVSSAITSAMSAWTTAASKYRIQIEQPGCKPQKLRVVFVSVVATSGADVSVTVNNQTPPTLPDGTTEELRSSVMGGVAMNFFVQGSGSINWTMIHEIGHTFGLPDEYTYNRPAATPAPTCKYKGADNPDKTITLSTSAIAAPAGQFGFDNASVMGQNGNTSYPDNLFYWISIEVKRILKAEGVDADVKVVAS